MLENKLGITSQVKLAKEEEKIAKIKAIELFDTNKINEYEIGTFNGLSSIHKFLFNDISSFAGKIRLPAYVLQRLVHRPLWHSSILHLQEARLSSHKDQPLLN